MLCQCSKEEEEEEEEEEDHLEVTAAVVSVSWSAPTSPPWLSTCPFTSTRKPCMRHVAQVASQAVCACTRGKSDRWLEDKRTPDFVLSAWPTVAWHADIHDACMDSQSDVQVPVSTSARVACHLCTSCHICHPVLRAFWGSTCMLGSAGAGWSSTISVLEDTFISMGLPGVHAGGMPIRSSRSPAPAAAE